MKHIKQQNPLIITSYEGCSDHGAEGYSESITTPGHIEWQTTRQVRYSVLEGRRSGNAGNQLRRQDWSWFDARARAPGADFRGFILLPRVNYYDKYMVDIHKHMMMDGI